MESSARSQEFDVLAGSEREQYVGVVQKALERHIKEEYSGAALTVFHGRTYRGESGHEHQIDISAEIDFAGSRSIILVECKNYSRRVAAEDIRTFAGRIRDVGATKGIVVTTVGFEEGARKVAEANGIALLLQSRLRSWWEVAFSTLLPSAQRAPHDQHVPTLNLKGIPKVVVEPVDAFVELTDEDPVGPFAKRLS